jgi:hypothetical protein
MLCLLKHTALERVTQSKYIYLSIVGLFNDFSGTQIMYHSMSSE